MKRLSVLLVFVALGLLPGCSSSSSSNNNPPTLTKIQVTPATGSVAAGDTQTFAAQATYSDGSTKDVTATATWSSSSQSIAIINSSGVATGKSVGSTTITASVSGMSGTAMLQVTAAVLVSIAVTPATPTMSPGTFQQFTATGTYSDGSTQNLSSTATWNSSATNIATISTAGYVTALALGNSTLTATSGSINGTTMLTVATPTLTSIEIPGGNLTIANGTSHAFNAIGIYSDGGKRVIISGVTWASSQTNVATITAAGVATGASVGQTMITATDGSISQNINLTVTNATLTHLYVAPSTDTIEPLTKLPFTAAGTFSDSSSQILTSFVTWGSSNTGVATMSTGAPQIGVATALASGNTNVSATSGSTSGTVPLTVATATLTGLTLAPSTASIALGSTIALRATAQYNDGNSVGVGTAVAWSSSDDTVATIVSGAINAVGTGTATITATLGSETATATITVENLQSIAITAAASPINVAPGTYIRLTAMGTLSDGTTTQDLTQSVGWTSGSPSVALMSNVAGSFGAAIGLAPGTSTIGAVLDGVVGSTQVTVTNATLTSIAVTPAAPSITLGDSQQFKAVGTFSDGSTEPLTSQATWSSSDLSVAIIDADGAATSSGHGATNITASMLGASSTPVVLTVP